MQEPINSRQYYSIRNSSERSVGIELYDLKKFLFETFEFFENLGYFAEAFGMQCQDNGYEPGYFDTGSDIMMKLKLGRQNMWPISEHYENYAEDDVFTIIEFIYDHISKPRNSTNHGWASSCIHYSEFNKKEAQNEFIERINFVLNKYENGWELSKKGEVLQLPPSGLDYLVDAKLKTDDMTTIDRVNSAISLFRKHGSMVEDRRAAVRELADVLEWIKPQVKTHLLRKDENELFNIANNFGIRHLNKDQKLDYDERIWLSWIFYHYLSTIHAVHHMSLRK